jgi:NADH:ubiquinone oxidoreductase subunit 4 (subunit M)
VTLLSQINDIYTYIYIYIILAGVLLKFGGYGLLRVFPVLFKFGFRFGVVWLALSISYIYIYIYIYIS